ncbi:MAG: hypothetical protein IKO48_03020 [Elusimicrobia bacterium]|nr:hypothetical protein [Elusimicrobiota bacterium]
MIKEKLKPILFTVAILVTIVIFALYLGYYMYYEGYIAADIKTCDGINYSIEQILLSKNTQEKKKELIEKLCSYTYAEISVENLSDDTMFYKKESDFKNEKLFKGLGLSAKTIKIKEDYYSIRYKIYIPTFYTTIRYCLYLGKHMTKI